VKNHAGYTQKKVEDFSPVSSSHYRGYVRYEWISVEFLDWLEKLPGALKGHRSTTIKDSKTTSIFRIAFSDQGSDVSGQKIYWGFGLGVRGSEFTNSQSRIPHPSLEICVKRYNYQNLFYALKYLFQQSRAKRAWEKANALLSLGILTPYPLAYLEKMFFGLLHHSFFITTWIDDALPLDSFFEKYFSQTLTVNILKEKWQFISEAARYVKTIHDLHIGHGDLKAKHILLKLNDGKYFFSLLDLDSLKIKKSLGQKERVRDLARLNASFLDTRVLSKSNRLRFLTTYLSETSQPDSVKRFYWEEIKAATQITLRKSKKRFM
jgi:tRNA A-37 threonylcarbamoyl transferase component Bud32